MHMVEFLGSFVRLLTPCICHFGSMDSLIPHQVAETNREMHMVEFLSNWAAGGAGGKGSAPVKTTDEIPDSEKYL